MRARRSPVIAPLLVASLVLTALAVASILRSPASEPVAATTPRFSIRGSVRGLYPGRTIRMRVRVENPLTVSIRVRSITARVRSPRSGCPARALVVRPWRGSVRIAPRRVRVLRLRVMMRRTAPNACRDVRFALAYSGSAVRG